MRPSGPRATLRRPRSFFFRRPCPDVYGPDCDRGTRSFLPVLRPGRSGEHGALSVGARRTVALVPTSTDLTVTGGRDPSSLCYGQGGLASTELFLFCMRVLFSRGATKPLEFVLPFTQTDRRAYGIVCLHSRMDRGAPYGEPQARVVSYTRVSLRSGLGLETARPLVGRAGETTAGGRRVGGLWVEAVTGKGAFRAGRGEAKGRLEEQRGVGPSLPSEPSPRARGLPLRTSFSDGPSESPISRRRAKRGGATCPKRSLDRAGAVPRRVPSSYRPGYPEERDGPKEGVLPSGPRATLMRPRCFVRCPCPDVF